MVEANGTGNARLDFSAVAPASIQINLSQSGPQTVIPGMLTLTLSDPVGIANVLGSPYDDTIIGNARDNMLLGGGGQDLIAGLGGNDVLEGGITRTILLDFNTFELPGEHIYTQAERDAIQAQLTADYSAFSYTLRPDASRHPGRTPRSSSTIRPHRPGRRHRRPRSTGATWTSPGSTMLDASGLANHSGRQRLRSTSTTCSAARASRRRRAPTSSPFRQRSPRTSSVTSPGLEHGDSYGPIGSGIYSAVDPGLYRPAYPGLTDADETIHHIMASGASVHATLFDAVNNPFFGEREAIKLALRRRWHADQRAIRAARRRWRPPSRFHSSRWSCPIPTSRASTPTASSTSPRPTCSATWVSTPRATRYRLLLVHGQGRHADQPSGHVATFSTAHRAPSTRR